MVHEDDGELLRECRSGDRKAFERLVEKYQKTVFNIALRMVRDREDAEDVAQAAFIKVYQRLDTFNPELKFFSWLYRIVVNESLNFLKQNRRHEPLDDAAAEMPEGDEKMEGEQREEAERKIQSGLMDLRVDYRAVVVLRHFQDLSYAEIAQILGISEKKVKSRLFTARMMLRDILLRKGLMSND